MLEAAEGDECIPRPSVAIINLFIVDERFPLDSRMSRVGLTFVVVDIHFVN